MDMKLFFLTVNKNFVKEIKMEINGFLFAILGYFGLLGYFLFLTLIVVRVYFKQKSDYFISIRETKKTLYLAKLEKRNAFVFINIDDNLPYKEFHDTIIRETNKSNDINFMIRIDGFDVVCDESFKLLNWDVYNNYRVIYPYGRDMEEKIRTRY